MLTRPTTRRPLWATMTVAASIAVATALLGFGPKSRDVGGAEARRGVGSADSVRIAT